MKRVLAGALALTLLLSGCSGSGTNSSSSSEESSNSSGTSIPSIPFGNGDSSSPLNGATIGDDGRLTGGYMDGEMGQRMPNTFFAYTVNSATLTKEYKGQTAPEGMNYLVTNLTIENVFGDTIEMYNSDFQIEWGVEDDECGYAVDPFSPDQMQLTVPMKADETITTNLVFEVPEGMVDYCLAYLEVYEDDYEGNAYFVFFTPTLDPSVPATNPSTPA